MAFLVNYSDEKSQNTKKYTAKKVFSVNDADFNTSDHTHGIDLSEIIKYNDWIQQQNTGDWVPYPPSHTHNPIPVPSNPTSGWGKGLGQIPEEELEDLLKKLQGVNKKKDQFDIEDLSEIEKQELVKEVKEIISRKR